jgi:hypothetical protein
MTTSYLRRRTALVLATAVLGLTLALVAACGDDDSSTATPTTASTGATATVAISAGAGTSTPGPGSSGASGTPTPVAGPEPPECAAASHDVGLVSQVSFNNEDGNFAQGETVDITLILANCGDNDAVLHYPTSQRYNFHVTDSNGVEVWTSSDGKSFDQVAATESLHPNDRETFTDHWDQKDRSGQQVPGGQYKVAAFSVGCIAEAQPNCEFGPVRFIQIAS